MTQEVFSFGTLQVRSSFCFACAASKTPGSVPPPLNETSYNTPFPSFCSSPFFVLFFPTHFRPDSGDTSVPAGPVPGFPFNPCCCPTLLFQVFLGDEPTRVWSHSLAFLQIFSSPTFPSDPPCGVNPITPPQSPPLNPLLNVDPSP